MSEITQLPVIVIGAGCTGLAIAQGLERANISCIVFERSDSLTSGTRDWNMGLHWGGPALRSVLPESMTKGRELREILQPLQVAPYLPTAHEDVMPMYNGQTGALMMRLPTPDYYRLRRSALRRFLADGIDVRWGKKLERLELDADATAATAHFADGSSARGRLVVGTDGARSAVRHQLLPTAAAAALTPLPYVSTFLQARFTAEQARYLASFHPRNLSMVHPAGMFAFLGMHDAADPSRPEDWVFFFYISWRSSPEEQAEEARTLNNRQRLAQVVERGTRFAAPVGKAYEWFRDTYLTGSGDDKPEPSAWHTNFHHFDPSEECHIWDNKDGMATLAGDAAHTMSHQRGQGLNHSFTDAANLVAAIISCTPTSESDGKAPKTRAEAVSAYEAEMRERAGTEVRMSTQQTVLMHKWEEVLKSPAFSRGISRGDAAQ